MQKETLRRLIGTGLGVLILAASLTLHVSTVDRFDRTASKPIVVEEVSR